MHHAAIQTGSRAGLQVPRFWENKLGCFWSQHFLCISKVLDSVVAIAIPSSVTFVDHAYTVKDIEMQFAHDTMMLEDCCSTEYDVMVP